MVKELEKKGIEVEPVRYDDFTGKKMTFFHDPNGLPLELLSLVKKNANIDDQ